MGMSLRAMDQYNKSFDEYRDPETGEIVYGQYDHKKQKKPGNAGLFLYLIIIMTRYNQMYKTYIHFLTQFLHI